VHDPANILITGGHGLLGRHAIEALRQHHRVHALVRAAAPEAAQGVTYQCVDLSQDWSAASLPRAIDVVIHLAQSSRFREFPEQALDVFRVNVDSTARLLDYARQAGARKFIYASSGGIYGAGPDAFHENSPIVDHGRLGYYLGSKVCGEVLAQSYASAMDVSILRFFFMYGAGQRRSMLIPRLVDNVRQGRPVTLQGADGIRINPVHVGDALAMVESCLTAAGSRTINVAGPDKLSLREIAAIIGLQLGVEPKFELSGGVPADLIGDNELMAAALGRPLTRFVAGVKDVL
jgi:UDP-glucose 4-epimerase